MYTANPVPIIISNEDILYECNHNHALTLCCTGEPIFIRNRNYPVFAGNCINA